MDAAVTGFTRGPNGHPLRGGNIGPGREGRAGDRLTKNIAYAVASPDVRIITPDPRQVRGGHRDPEHRPEMVNLGDVLRLAESAEDD
ncbi:hypothetical protein GCM10023238_13280 [Streptomyces heliomycini]